MSIADKVNNWNATDIEKVDLTLFNECLKKLESSVRIEMLSTLNAYQRRGEYLEGIFGIVGGILGGVRKKG